jgi:predicted ferric reductase
VWRRRLGLSYEAWRVLHGILAVVAVAAALVHVERVGHYVSGPWKQGLWALFSAVFVALLVNTRVVQPVRQLRRPWRVTSVEPERGDAWTLTLAPEGHGGLRFLPGQFAWLRVHRSPFAVREHPFSFSSSAERPERLSFTIKAAGDFTSRVGAIRPGTRAYVDGPYGVFSYDRNQGDGFVFVAGGVGITPIMSMLRTLADRGDRRPCLLLYGNADWDGVIFREELEDLRDRLDLRVVHVPESPPGGWEGESGLMDDGLLDRHLPERPERQRYFLCGPPPMMAAVRDLLAERGVAPADIEFERFDLI